MMTRCFCIQNEDEVDLIDDLDCLVTNNHLHTPEERFINTESEANKKGMINDRTPTENIPSVHYTNSSLLDNNSSHITTAISTTSSTCTSNNSQDFISPRRTITSLLEFFRLKRSTSSSTASNSCSNNRTQMKNSCANSNTMRSCNTHLHMMPMPFGNNSIDPSCVNDRSIPGTQSIEKLYVSRKDNPVYSMLPQNDPSDSYHTQSSIRIQPLDNRNDDADWIQEDVPPEHNALIRSPPPIKRLDSPFLMASAKSSPIRNRVMKGKDLRSRDVDTINGGLDNVTQFITAADVCPRQSSCVNGNHDQSYT